MFSCFLCKSKFKTTKFYVGHLKLVHKITKSTALRCSYCPQSFQSLNSFKRHIHKHAENSHSKSPPETYENSEINFKDMENRHLSSSFPNSSFCSIPENVTSTNEKIHENMKHKHLVDFFLKLYAKPSLSRKIVTEIINEISVNLVSVIFDSIECSLSSCSCIEDVSNKLKECLNDFKTLFDNFCSEYKVLNYLQEKKLYFEPKEFLIDDCLTINNISSSSAKGVLIPLKENLSQFFALPNVLSDMLKNLNSLEKDTYLRNIVQGSVWREKSEKLKNKIVLPYLLYQDEFETNNPLGSKRGVDKLSAFYLTFPLLENSNSSKLSSIFLCYLTKSSYLMYGNSSNFGMLYSELKCLEDGIDVITNEGILKIHLILASLVGDNLGLNTILGFCRSFSANSYCRICKGSKLQMQKQISENKNILRNEENYLNDISKQDISLTGIKELCVFNQLEYFNVTDCVAVDLMHDFLEGICQIELGFILNNFIVEKSFFPLSTLNYRKIHFDYGCDKSNLSSEISLNHIKDRKFKMSASEMKTFLHYLPLMLRDLVPKKNTTWSLLLLLTQIIEACFMPYFDESSILDLEKIISQHHKLYINLSKMSLTPKHHFIVHYPYVIRKLGPFKGLWTMRFEAKHKDLKTYASVITSRKNICLSLAKKFQFEFAFNLYSQKYLKNIQNKKHNEKDLDSHLIKMINQVFY